jgi:hypothetical protein
MSTPDPSTFVRTPILRFVERQVKDGKRTATIRVLQQWWAPNMPSYMNNGEGEWRDVELQTEHSP